MSSSIMSCLLSWCTRRYRKKTYTTEEEKHDEEESEALMEQCKIKGRREAICEMSHLDGQSLVKQLERYVRMHRLSEYGIIKKSELLENNALQHLSGPLLQPHTQSNYY